MLKLTIFQAIGDLVVGANSRQTAKYGEFLAFYRGLVESLPSEATEAFGNMGLKIIQDGKVEDVGIELTATDFIWWKQKIEQFGARFVGGPDAVQLEMLNRLSQKAEACRLTPKERKALLALLDEANTTA